MARFVEELQAIIVEAQSQAAKPRPERLALRVVKFVKEELLCQARHGVHINDMKVEFTISRIELMRALMQEAGYSKEEIIEGGPDVLRELIEMKDIVHDKLLSLGLQSYWENNCVMYIKKSDL